MFMRVLIGVFALAMAGCTTVGAGVSAMSGEMTQATMAGSDILDHKQEFTSLYVFGSTKYTDISAGTLTGTIETSESGYTYYFGKQVITQRWDIEGSAFSFYLKYPFSLMNDRLILFPLAGFDLHFYQRSFNFGSDYADTMLYGKIGGGLDFNFSKLFFLRGRIMYAPLIVSGLTFNLGIGYRLQSDEVRQRYRTVAEMAAAEEKAAADAKAREMEAIQNGGKLRTLRVGRLSDWAMQEACGDGVNGFPCLFQNYRHRGFSSTGRCRVRLSDSPTEKLTRFVTLRNSSDDYMNKSFLSLA
jgi:hypothetical protein